MLVLFDNGKPRSLARYLIDRQKIGYQRNFALQKLATVVLKQGCSSFIKPLRCAGIHQFWPVA
jgi:hypothetical protein